MFNGIGIDLSNGHALFDYEARAMRAFRDRNILEAMENAKKWAKYQPLSSRPLLFGSYIMSVLMNDNRSAIEFIRSAKQYSSYADPMVINNLAFFLASDGKISEALGELRRLATTDINADDKACITATKGLILFRSNRQNAGRREYEKAAMYFRRRNQFSRLALSLMFLGRELIRERDEQGVDLFKEVDELSKAYELWDVRMSAEGTLRSVALGLSDESVTGTRATRSITVDNERMAAGDERRLDRLIAGVDGMLAPSTNKEVSTRGRR